MNVASIHAAASKVSKETARPAMLLVEDNPKYHGKRDRTRLVDLVRRAFGTTIRIHHVHDASSAMEVASRERIDVLLVDSGLPTIEAMPLLGGTDEHLHDAAIIVVGWEDDPSGKEWIQRGADDFVFSHELSPQRVDVLMAKASRARRLRRENAHILEQLRHTGREFDHFVRALSHDMSANFMLLESSFSQLQSHLGPTADNKTVNALEHTDACLAESKRFLEDLVQLAKTGSVEMEPEIVYLNEIVAEVLFEQDELFVQGGIDIDVQSHLPGVWCNRQRVKQVVTNLIRNAVKHGCDTSDPRITISAKHETDRVLLQIHDNGAGIEPEMHKDIFLPGRRLPSASEEGSGMGLAIVQKIAEHYEGSAWVDPATTSGTAIIVSLPAVPANSMPSAAMGEIKRRAHFSRGSTADLHPSHSRKSKRHR